MHHDRHGRPCRALIIPPSCPPARGVFVQQCSKHVIDQGSPMAWWEGTETDRDGLSFFCPLPPALRIQPSSSFASFPCTHARLLALGSESRVCPPPLPLCRPKHGPRYFMQVSSKMGCDEVQLTTVM
ncbi:hypothetical protein BS50DRAFT_109027 [Corynespora cassiicola Philippines]|uniref:Uncharacterized protein n=1 Tax=Corynespora cassiicola Philippines TaxID=1448308 RepID=A0A2T2NCV3_CORCC|nr:hypothetical protein BS50DRAFT_109027 [Corynespora cassiicola Philippines]